MRGGRLPKLFSLDWSGRDSAVLQVTLLILADLLNVLGMKLHVHGLVLWHVGQVSDATDDIKREQAQLGVLVGRDYAVLPLYLVHIVRDVHVLVVPGLV